MKKIFLTIAKYSATTTTLVFLMVAPFQPLIAQAQVADSGVVDQQLTAQSQTTVAQTQATINSGGTAAPTTASPASTPTSTTPPGSAVGIPTTGCSFSPYSWDLCITNVVYVFTVGIGSGFAYISAYFFDWAIALSLNGGIYALDFVSQGWTTARDIANMAFLFILLYIAFKIIFSAETSDTVHMLVMVIVIALLVNFSFFFTRLAIDAGNILSIQFYNAIQAPSIQTTASTAGNLSSPANAVLFNNAAGAGNQKDLTASIMGMLNLQGLFNTQSFQNWYSPGGIRSNGPNFMVVVISLSFLYIAAGIMFWLLTVAFVTNGVKFLFRIVILWFLIIAAPLAFVAYVIPKFHDYYKQWQDALIKHAFYPAAFMFIFLILTNFSNEMGTGNSNNLTNGLFNGLTAANGASPVAAVAIVAANIFIRLGFVIAMLYIGMEAAKKIGVFGAEAANHAGNWVSGRMTGAFRTTGGVIGAGIPAWALRNTVGWAGDTIYKSDRARNWAAQGGWFARTGWRAAGAAGRQSYDARGGLAAIGVKENLVGKPGGEGGYTAAYDARVKMRTEEAAKLKPSDLKYEQALQAEINKDPGKKTDLKKAVDEVERTKKLAEDNGSEDDKKNYSDARKAYSKIAEPIIKAAKTSSGYDNDEKYAKSIEKTTWRNLGGALQNKGIPGYIRSADKAAGVSIRGAKTDAERIKNMLPKASSSGSGGSTASGAGGATTMAPLTRAAQAASQKTGEQLAQGILKAVNQKFGSGNLWQANRTGGNNPINDRLMRNIRDEMRENRKVLTKGFRSLSRGPEGSGTLRDSGRGRREEHKNDEQNSDQKNHSSDEEHRPGEHQE